MDVMYSMSVVPCECSHEEEPRFTSLPAQANYSHFAAPNYHRRRSSEHTNSFHQAFADPSQPSPSGTSGDDSKSKFKSFFAASSSSSSPVRDRERKSADSVDSAEKMKTKIKSMWNNVKYGWTVKMKTNFSKTTDLWLLGKCYYQNERSDPADVSSEFEAFRLDCCSRIWLTYRREFQSLAGSSLTTDCGWGCMLRSGQMMLAEAFVRHFLGREWRWNMEQQQQQKEFHRAIIRWFGDVHSEISPFSLHHLVAVGESTGKKAGDWYGPASVAHILKQAMEQAEKKHTLLSELCVYFAQDCTVYKQDVYDLCQKSTGCTNEWRGVIILIPVRLGGEAFNPVYISCLKDILMDQNCIGIIGGKPKHSLYFIGWQGEKLIHLDPHYCQEVVDVAQTNFDFQSFHCSAPRKMTFTRMDPSCTIGFYCQLQQDFQNFIELSEMMVEKNSRNGEYPIFIVADGKSIDCTFQPPRRFEETTMTLFHPADNSYDSSDEADEFVVL